MTIYIDCGEFLSKYMKKMLSDIMLDPNINCTFAFNHETTNSQIILYVEEIKEGRKDEALV